MNFCQNEERVKRGWLILGGLLAAVASSTAQTVVNVNSAASSIPNNTNLPNGATVIVEDGGSIGLNVSLVNGILQVEGGAVASAADSFSDGFSNSNNEVILTGGIVGDYFQLMSGTELTVAGGSVRSFGVFPGSEAAIFSGAITRFPDILNGGVVNFYGGDINAVRVFNGGEAHFFGSEFALNGVPITGLIRNEAFEVDTRNVTLTGTLSDGSPFETDLNTSFGAFLSSNPDGAASGATVTVTEVTGEVSSPNSARLDAEVEFTSAQAGSIRVLSVSNRIYRLRRTTDLTTAGAIIDVQTGNGSELVFSFDDSSSTSPRAFFIVEEVSND